MQYDDINKFVKKQLNSRFSNGVCNACSKKKTSKLALQEGLRTMFEQFRACHNVHQARWIDPSYIFFRCSQTWQKWRCSQPSIQCSWQNCSCRVSLSHSAMQVHASEKVLAVHSAMEKTHCSCTVSCIQYYTAPV